MVIDTFQLFLICTLAISMQTRSLSDIVYIKAWRTLIPVRLAYPSLPYRQAGVYAYLVIP